jgi:hypothetical protein
MWDRLLEEVPGREGVPLAVICVETLLGHDAILWLCIVPGGQNGGNHQRLSVTPAVSPTPAGEVPSHRSLEWEEHAPRIHSARTAPLRAGER